ncbi:MAG TPA: sporulation integral membrane protein YlbJ [Candidatus Avamphibacillus intestinigallinarum]|nr:sporulation integral membrane protein YlbJ [Candidatus Avamphibacillus intestinigallinarum]
MLQLFKTFFLATTVVCIGVSLIIFPSQALEASIRGLNMWWEIVFPSLLPFFITAELLISFGVVHFLGVLFEPIMRPLFKVPGVGSFGWIMGMASGYPTGAKIAVRLREEGQVTKQEAERLISFTNASSPLFLFGAVSIGFFHDTKLGLLFAITHYLGNVCVGLIMRFYGRKEDARFKKAKSNQRFSFIYAFKLMHRKRIEANRPIGIIISDAVLNSIQTLIMVGGFIILFSVFTKLIYLVGVSGIFALILRPIFELLQLPTELTIPFISGLFEITLGSQMISQLGESTILSKAILVSFLIGFNGLSIHSQVASIIAKSDISYLPYLYGRLLHGLFASTLTYLLFKPLYINRQVFDFRDWPVFNQSSQYGTSYIYELLHMFGPIITIISLSLGVIVFLYRKSYKPH